MYVAGKLVRWRGSASKRERDLGRRLRRRGRVKDSERSYTSWGRQVATFFPFVCYFIPLCLAAFELSMFFHASVLSPLLIY